MRDFVNTIRRHRLFGVRVIPIEQFVDDLAITLPKLKMITRSNKPYWRHSQICLTRSPQFRWPHRCIYT
jgi:hypothetical protein